MEIHKITDQLCIFLADSTYDMIRAIQNEEYELATDIRDDIESKINKVHSLLVRKEMTKLTPTEVRDQLEALRLKYIRMCEDILGVPGELAVYNI